MHRLAPKTARDGSRKAKIEAFTKAYDMACDSLNNKGLAKYADVISKYCHVGEKTIKALPKLHFPHAAQPREKDIVKAQNMNWND